MTAVQMCCSHLFSDPWREWNDPRYARVIRQVALKYGDNFMILLATCVDS